MLDKEVVAMLAGIQLSVETREKVARALTELIEAEASREVQQIMERAK
jgi:hypothetical protein